MPADRRRGRSHSECRREWLVPAGQRQQPWLSELIWPQAAPSTRRCAGLRVPARNALLADMVPDEWYGRAYGFERAMDNFGAIGGPLVAIGLVAWVGPKSIERVGPKFLDKAKVLKSGLAVTFARAALRAISRGACSQAAIAPASPRQPRLSPCPRPARAAN